MANTSAIRGFVPKRYLNGAAWSGQVTPYIFDAGDGTATFIGDLVTAAGNHTQVAITGSGYNGLYLPRIKQSAASDTAIIGSLEGLEPLTSNLTTLYRLASTQRVAFVADDPNIVFHAQTNGATGITAANITKNYHITVGAGSTTTGISAMQVDDSSVATTSTFELRMLRIVPSSDNAPGQYNKVECMLNNCFFKAGTAGV